MLVLKAENSSTIILTTFFVHLILEGLTEEQHNRKKELERIMDGKRQRARAKERGKSVDFL